jgi:hypothetical protein
VLKVFLRLVCQPLVLEVNASKMDSDDYSHELICVIMRYHVWL